MQLEASVLSEGAMKKSARTSAARLALASLLVACVCAAQAQDLGQLDKHARKVQHRLAKYGTGSYLHLVLSDDTESYGALGTLSENSFTFISADSNATATYAYDDVDRVRTDKEIIGEGAEPRRHIRHLVPILLTAATAGAGALAYEAVR
jgi:hypothetical protein